MTSLVYTTSQSLKDLTGIIDLQRNNLAVNLAADDILNQGFVTIVHNIDDLKKMNDIEEHVICKNGEKVIAYLLSMTVHAQNDIPVLIPMFDLFKKILFMNKPVATYNYIVVGQVCIDKDYRGKGILDNCYEFYKKCFKGNYDFAITEIATRNQRSIKAHERIGFKEIHRYTSADNEEWSIVVWCW